MQDQPDIERGSVTTRQSVSLRHTYGGSTTAPEIAPSALNAANRFVRDYELRLMQRIPDFHPTLAHATIITPDRLSQWNSEVEEFETILDKDTLKTLTWITPYLEQACIAPPEGTSLQTLAPGELSELENLVNLHDGRSVMGYTSNEKLWLLFWGFITRTPYPPTEKDKLHQMLMFAHKPITQDVSMAIQNMAKAFVVFVFAENAYATYSNKSQEARYQFEERLYLIAIIAFPSLALLLLLSLRLQCIKKEKVQEALFKASLIQESTIRYAETWLTFGADVFNPVIINAAFLPILVIGLWRGIPQEEKEWLNIHSAPHRKMLTNSLFWSLGVASLIKFGIAEFVYDAFLAKHIELNNESLEVYNNDLDIAANCALALSFCAFLAQHPGFNNKTRLVARYSTNALNGFSLALLNNAVIYQFFEIFLSFTGNIASKNTGWNILWNTFFFGLQPIILAFTLPLTFTTTKDLTKLSVKPLPPVKRKASSTCDKVSYFFAPCNVITPCSTTTIIQNRPDLLTTGLLSLENRGSNSLLERFSRNRLWRRDPTESTQRNSLVECTLVSSVANQ